MGVIINGGMNISSGGISISLEPYNNNICVSGAGTPEVNGTYIKINESRYDSSNYAINGIRLTTEYGPWGIIIGGGGNPTFYFGQTTPPPQYPWQETLWTASDGELPVPNVSYGPC
jgi:hypothetical protein